MSETQDATRRPTGGEGNDQGTSVGTQAVEAVQQRTEVARDEMAHLAETAQDQVRDLAGEATAQLRGRIDEQGAHLGDAARQFGSELSSMARNADDPDRPAARVVSEVGERITDTADRLQQRGVDGVLDDVKGFARRHPGQFIFGAAAAGFVVGRLIRNVDRGAIAEQVKTGASDDATPSLSPSQPVIDLTTQDEAPALAPPVTAPVGTPSTPTQPDLGAPGRPPVAGVAGEELGAW